MNVEELHPIIVTTVTLSLLCPICKEHDISVIIAPGQWQWDGKTLSPSVRFGGGYFIKGTDTTKKCEGHFTITNGQVNIC